jgi:hypothetical protein
VKYAAIIAHVGLFTVAFMCRELDLAPSGYYAPTSGPRSASCTWPWSSTSLHAAWSAGRSRPISTLASPRRHCGGLDHDARRGRGLPASGRRGRARPALGHRWAAKPPAPG